MKEYKKITGALLAALVLALCACGFLAACGAAEREMTDDDASTLSEALMASFAYAGSYTFGFSVATEAEMSGLSLSETEREICSFDSEGGTCYMYSYVDDTIDGLLGSSVFTYDLYEAYAVKGDDGLYGCYLYRDIDGAVARVLSDERLSDADMGDLSLAELLEENDNLDAFAVCDTVARLKDLCARMCGTSSSDVSATVSGSGKNRSYTLSCSVAEITSSYTSLYTYAYTFTVKNGLLSSMFADATFYDYAGEVSTGSVHEEMTVEYRYDASLAKTHFSDLSLFGDEA